MVFLSSPHTRIHYMELVAGWTKLRNYFVHRRFLCVLRSPHSCCWLHSYTHSVLHESKATEKKNRSFETNNVFQFYLFADQQIHQFYTQPSARARARERNKLPLALPLTNEHFIHSNENNLILFDGLVARMWAERTFDWVNLKRIGFLTELKLVNERAK